MQVLKSFSKLCPSSSLVTRGGEATEVDSTELVMGDVVTLKWVCIGLGWVGMEGGGGLVGFFACCRSMGVFHAFFVCLCELCVWQVCVECEV